MVQDQNKGNNSQDDQVDKRSEAILTQGDDKRPKVHFIDQESNLMLLVAELSVLLKKS